MTMAARVVYGMAHQGDLPGFAGRVHPKTATPLIATALIVAATLALALLVPFERLAEGTSLATLVVFALVNLSLLRLRHRKVHTDGPHVRVPLWVPAAGFASCLAMMAAACSVEPRAAGLRSSQFDWAGQGFFGNLPQGPFFVRGRKKAVLKIFFPCAATTKIHHADKGPRSPSPTAAVSWRTAQKEGRAPPLCRLIHARWYR